jgi:Zn-dependent protease
MLAQALSSSIRIFRVFGIDVYLHSTWFILAVFQFFMWRGYSEPIWNLAQFLGIFAIVLLHEFGHALACRSVGGEARHIVLWPLGGVAFVRPPNRPWPVLWSIAAGPLVNVLLMPVFIVLYLATQNAASPDLQRFGLTMLFINVIILAFNMLPIYPLDGGQIVQSLLWMVIGRTRSLLITAGFGLVVAIIGGSAALYIRDPWLVVLAIFIGWQAYGGWRTARAMAHLERQQSDVE